jgi:hypothetical protein
MFLHLGKMNAQDAAFRIFEGMIFFHNYILFFVIFIGVVITILPGKIFVSFSIKKKPISDEFTLFTLLEIV